MDKSRARLPIIGSVSVIVCLLLFMVLGGAPRVEGGYVNIRINPGVFASSYLGTNTYLEAIQIIDDQSDNYTFDADGETILNIPENRVLTSVYAWVLIDDNYASSTLEASNRTRITITLKDADTVTQFDNTITAITTSVDFGLYYRVGYSENRSILLTAGTWDLSAEYEILAIPP